MPPKKNAARRNLTYQEKLTIIKKKDQEPSWTQENLALWARERFKLATKPTQATISNILRSREKLQSVNVPPHFRSARPVKNPELDAAMIEWVLSMLNAKAPLTRDAIQQKATSLAQEMQILDGISFSKGWVSSFMKRHQLHFRKKHSGSTTDIDMEVIRQPMVAPPMRVMPSRVLNASTRQPAKRKRITVWDSDNNTPEGRAIQSILLEWVATPGNYVRWKMLKPVEAKQPLFDEINNIARSHGIRELSATEIRVRIITLVKSFNASSSWLAETGLQEAFAMEKATGGNDISAHVASLCPHFDMLAPVLSDYVNDIEDDEDAELVDAAASANTVVDNNEQMNVDMKVKQAAKRRRSPKIPEKPVDKAQQQLLFDLECEKLKCDIEAKHVQLMLEKTLARKKLLDAGIPAVEVDKIFPL